MIGIMRNTVPTPLCSYPIKIVALTLGGLSGSADSAVDCDLHDWLLWLRFFWMRRAA